LGRAARQKQMRSAMPVSCSRSTCRTGQAFELSPSPSPYHAACGLWLHTQPTMGNRSGPSPRWGTQSAGHLSCLHWDRGPHHEITPGDAMHSAGMSLQPAYASAPVTNGSCGGGRTAVGWPALCRHRRFFSVGAEFRHDDGRHYILPTQPHQAPKAAWQAASSF
jgi:hypothetical protein